MALLEIKDIHKSFGNLNVLNGIDLTVNKGDVIAILGPSGSGKTTLLRCINYLETADAGTMIFNGKSYDLSNTSKKDVAQLRKYTGFVFQNYNLFANKTALQNVILGLTVARNVSKEEANVIGMQMLEKSRNERSCDSLSFTIIGWTTTACRNRKSFGNKSRHYLF